MNRLLVAGVKDGIDHKTAMRLVDQAFQSESRDMEFLASQVIRTIRPLSTISPNFGSIAASPLRIPRNMLAS